jgi:hypothetical protein
MHGDRIVTPRQFGSESKISVGILMVVSTSNCMTKVLVDWLKESRVRLPCTAEGNVRACSAYLTPCTRGGRNRSIAAERYGGIVVSLGLPTPPPCNAVF